MPPLGCLTLLALVLLAPPALGAADGRSVVAAPRSWLGDARMRQALHAAASGDVICAACSASDVPPAVGSATRRCISDVCEALCSGARWALKMQDAAVKIPEGILELSLTHLGHWKECVALGDEEELIGRFQGQMCLIGFSPLSVDTFPAEYLSALRIRLGVCLPSSCSVNDVSEIFRFVVEKIHNTFEIELNATVSEDDCTTSWPAPAFDASDWAAVGLLSGLGAVVLLSTAYDLTASRKRVVLTAFSVVANGKKLFAMPHGGGDQTLSCLHGIRFVSMCWVVLGHRYVVSTYVPSINPSFMIQFTTDWYRIAVANATIAVDTFLVLSGLLVGYLFFKQEPSKRRLNIPIYYAHRYIRLTPALAMMALLNATLAMHIGWGPMWTEMMSNMREACRKNWWNTLLYVGNYVEPELQCVDQSWYLMVDMQLHWLSPLLLLPMARWPQVGAALLAGLSVAGIAANFAIAHVKRLPPNMLGITDTEVTDFFLTQYYVPTHTRFVPYVLGLAIGYILAIQRTDGEKPKPLILWKSLLAWLAAAALLLVPLMTGFEFLQDPLPDRGWMALYNSLWRPVWALGVGTVVYLCANGNGGPVNQLLSWWGLQFLSRLSYSVYLVHATLQMMMAGSVKTSVYLEDGNIFPSFLGDLTLSLLFATILSLLCESPFLILEKELLRRNNAASDEVPAKPSAVKDDAAPSVPSAAVEYEDIRPKPNERLV